MKKRSRKWTFLPSKLPSGQFEAYYEDLVDREDMVDKEIMVDRETMVKKEDMVDRERIFLPQL